MLISEHYANLNRNLHRKRSDYGRIGHKWAKKAAEICERHGYKEVLDYGCGKGTFKQAMPEHVTVHEYDPGVPGKELRHTAGLVVCTDVLEHVEPEYIDDVILDIRQLCDRALLVINTTASNKKLDDGRNAHLIQEGRDWWLERLRPVFDNIEEHKSPKPADLVFEAW